MKSNFYTMIDAISQNQSMTDSRDFHKSVENTPSEFIPSCHIYKACSKKSVVYSFIGRLLYEIKDIIKHDLKL